MLPSPREMSRTNVRVAETAHNRDPKNRRRLDSRLEGKAAGIGGPCLGWWDIHRSSWGHQASANSRKRLNIRKPHQERTLAGRAEVKNTEL